MQDQTCREGRKVRRSCPARDRHKPQLHPGGTVDGHQDTPITPGNPAARGCQGPPRPAGLSSAISEMPACERPSPKFQEGLNKHPISLCPEHAGGEAVASGGQRAEYHPKTRPERIWGGSPLHASARKESRGQHRRVQPSHGKADVPELAGLPLCPRGRAPAAPVAPGRLAPRGVLPVLRAPSGLSRCLQSHYWGKQAGILPQGLPPHRGVPMAPGTSPREQLRPQAGAPFSGPLSRGSDSSSGHGGNTGWPTAGGAAAGGRPEWTVQSCHSFPDACRADAPLLSLVLRLCPS